MLNDQRVGEDVEVFKDRISVGSMGGVGNGSDYFFLQEMDFTYIGLGGAAGDCCTVVEVGMEEGMVKGDEGLFGKDIFCSVN